MKFGLSNTVLENFNQVFLKYPEIEEVLIYGSRAKDTFREGSDIDLSLKGKVDSMLLAQIWLDLDSLNTPYLIDVNIYQTLTSESLKNHIDRIGKTLYTKKTDILV